MAFVLGAASRAQLVGVHPLLIQVVQRAIEITEQDFAVHEGLRTLERQHALVAAGASKTLKSRHLAQADGFGHAVDLYPFVAGRLQCEWGPIWPVADAMRRASVELAIPITWGGVWDRWLTDLPPTVAGLKNGVAAYQKRHPGPDFLDGPHFQLELS